MGRPLRELARLFGIQCTYRDVWGREQRTSDEALLGMLACLGTAVRSKRDVERALTSEELARWRRLCEPVAVVRGRRKPLLALRIGERDVRRGFRVRVVREDGEVRSQSGNVADLRSGARRRIGGQRFVEKILVIDEVLPFGYHRAEIEIGSRREEAFLICAPRRAWVPDERGWGIFAPVYALGRAGGMGAGDLSDLAELVEWTASLGGKLVGTLPLLAAFLDEPFDASPYAPASRLFWNELYLDLESVPDLTDCEPARRRLESPGFVREVARLREAPLVDYRRLMALKRSVLWELSRCYFDRDNRSDLESFVESRPLVDDYARFRAVLAAAGRPWLEWPQALREGRVEPRDYSEDERRYHLYVQWRIAQQMENVARRGLAAGVGIYLDLPLGVHPAGYDVWREQETFVRSCSLGAPPDVVYPEGQRWGVTPIHPQKQRLERYRYFVECIRHHLRAAGALRIDHVMGIHRAWCVPSGMSPADGAYLSYPYEEVYAILALESHRHRSFLVGEDLGTVPPEVRKGMRENGLLHMHVLQYELEGAPKDPLSRVPRGSVASLNTHDFLPFAAWWHEDDVAEREANGSVDATGAAKLRAERSEARSLLRDRLGAKSSDFDVLRRVLEAYAASAAPWLIVNLEDLWMEREPQNRPGTGDQRPNWRRKLRHPLHQFQTMPQVRRVLRRIQAARKSGTTRSA